jgi:hypothetical protein
MRTTVGTVYPSSLCERCAGVRVVVTPKGSRFLLCERSKRDGRFPKYPPQPVASCAGFEAAEAGRPGSG